MERTERCGRANPKGPIRDLLGFSTSFCSRSSTHCRLYTLSNLVQTPLFPPFFPWCLHSFLPVFLMLLMLPSSLLTHFSLNLFHTLSVLLLYWFVLSIPSSSSSPFTALLPLLPQCANIFQSVGETKEKQAALSEDVPTAEPFPRLSLWRRTRNIPENVKHSDEAF